MLGAPIISFFVGSAFVPICFLRDNANKLPQLNAIATSAQNLLEAKKRFGYIARFYSDAKQLSAKNAIRQFNEINRFLPFN